MFDFDGFIVRFINFVVMDFFEALLTSIINLSILEWAAIVFGYIFLLYVAKFNRIAWYILIISTAIYGYLCIKEVYIMEFVIQLCILTIALLGIVKWRRVDNSPSESKHVIQWGVYSHLYALIILIIGSLAIGSYYALFTHLDLPFLDSVVKSGLIMGYFMLTRKALEGWVYLTIAFALGVILFYYKAFYLISFFYLLFAITSLICLLYWIKIRRAAIIHD